MADPKSGNDDDDMKTVITKPELAPVVEAESFTTNSLLHKERLERQKRKPGLLPRPIASFFVGVLVIGGIYAAVKLVNMQYGSDIGATVSEALSNMREWFIK